MTDPQTAQIVLSPSMMLTLLGMSGTLIVAILGVGVYVGVKQHSVDGLQKDMESLETDVESLETEMHDDFLRKSFCEGKQEKWETAVQGYLREIKIRDEQTQKDIKSLCKSVSKGNELNLSLAAETREQFGMINDCLRNIQKNMECD